MLGTILFIYPELNEKLQKINETSNVILIFIVIVAAYICGHTSYILSKSLTDLLKVNQDKFKEYSIEKQRAVIQGIERVYKTDFGLNSKLEDYRDGLINGSELQIKNHCFAIVDSKQVEHDKFVSLADFSRSVSLNLFIASLVYLIYWLSGMIDGFGITRSLLLVIGLCISGFLLFRRSIRFRMAADSIIYSSFIAQTRETTI